MSGVPACHVGLAGATMGPAIGAGAPSIIRIQFRGTLSAPCLKDDGY